MTGTALLRRTIFAGCKQLGLDDDTRRELQLVATGKASLSEMGADDMRAVVEALRARGFQLDGRPRRHPRAPRADLRLVHVLWRHLGEAGALDRPGRDGLNAFVRSRFGKAWGSVPADIDMLRDHDRIATVIDALRAMCDRAGVRIDAIETGR
jgi:phage gp16-like protein